MPGPRYVPRDFCEDPSAFGRDAAARWKRPTSLVEAVQTRAARLQHLYAMRIRERLAAKSMTLKGFAVAAGTTPQRLNRVMRGEILMRLEDVAAGDLVLDEISEPARTSGERERTRRDSDRARVEEVVRATIAALREEGASVLDTAPGALPVSPSLG